MSLHPSKEVSSEDGVEHAIRVMDLDGDGRISRDEFVGAVQLLFREALTKEQTVKLFNTMDAKKTGYISKAEVAKFCSKQIGDRRFGLELLSHLQSVFAAFDKDRNGKLNFKEFKTCLRLYDCKESDEELQRLFSSALVDASEEIGYLQFMGLVRNSSIVKNGPTVETTSQVHCPFIIMPIQ